MPLKGTNWSALLSLKTRGYGIHNYVYCTRQLTVINNSRITAYYLTMLILHINILHVNVSFHSDWVSLFTTGNGINKYGDWTMQSNGLQAVFATNVLGHYILVSHSTLTT